MFSLLFPKKNAVHTDLLRGAADVHSHLLPGVDDGVQSADDMRAALEAMLEAGVERVFLTPHVMADLPDNRRSYLQDRFACVKQSAPEGIELRLAAEYMLDAGFRLQMADGLLTYADRQVLVETSYLSPSPDYLNLLYELSLEGYTACPGPSGAVYVYDEGGLFPAEGQGLQVPVEPVLPGWHIRRPSCQICRIPDEGGFLRLCRLRPASSRRLQEKPCPPETFEQNARRCQRGVGEQQEVIVFILSRHR